jgi:hypothetical protein
MIRHRLPRQTTPSRSSSSSRLSELKEYMLRRGCWLGTLCVVVIVVMTIGVVFTAHQYYHDFGGQGWLKSRTQHREGNTTDKAQLYLPMRQIQMFRKPAFWERQEGDDIPFYTCGDQRNSCASFNQPVSLLLLYRLGHGQLTCLKGYMLSCRDNLLGCHLHPIRYLLLQLYSINLSMRSNRSQPSEMHGISG